MKKLTSFDSVFSAQLAKGLLESNGIRCEVLNQNMGMVMPYEGAIDSLRPYIVVADEDLAEARRIISQTYPAAITESVCPVCDSSNLGVKVAGGWLKRLSLIFMGMISGSSIPPNRLQSKVYCRDCGSFVETLHANDLNNNNI